LYAASYFNQIVAEKDQEVRERGSSTPGFQGGIIDDSTILCPTDQASAFFTQS